MQKKIEELLARGIRFGTSSWKYPGWKGLVYDDAYTSEKDFKERCLEEYARHYPCVGVDHTYYAWPMPAMFSKYAHQTPESFRFGLKVTEKVTVLGYPNHKRYGKDAGKANESFLDPKVFVDNFLTPLADVKDRLGPVMLEFSHFYPGTIGSGREFTQKLDAFFGALGTGKDFQYAVEIRNAAWLKPPYFEMLAKHGVAHVFNSWTKMPSLPEQLALTADFPQPFYPARLLLQPGTKYEEAVEAFSPYDRLQEEHPPLREGAALLVQRALKAGVPAFVFVNNRAEGCAPKTIDAILQLVSSAQ